MRNAVLWQPSKYRMVRGGLTATANAQELAVGSRLMATLIAREYSRTAPLHARGTLLDLGCGKVPLYDLYRLHTDRVICLDWPGSLHGGLHVDAYCDLATFVPLRDCVADTIVSADVLEHLRDPGGFFHEVYRLLNPGGALLLNTPFLYRVHEAPHDYLRHTRYSLESLAVAAGLEIVELREIGSVTDVLADTMAKLLATLPVVGPFLARLVQTLALHLGGTRVGARLTRVTGPTFPLAHFLVARRPRPELAGGSNRQQL